MSLLSDADLAYVRAEAAESLRDTCDIERVSLDADGQGGFTESRILAYTSVACRLAPRETMRGRRIVADALVPDAAWVITLPAGQAVETGWRISHNGAWYDVAWVDNGSSYQTARRVLARRIG